MKCPDCDEEMDREDGASIKGPPNCIYSCEECGSEFVWTKGVKGLRRIAEGVPNSAAILNRNHF